MLGLAVACGGGDEDGDSVVGDDGSGSASSGPAVGSSGPTAGDDDGPEPATSSSGGPSATASSDGDASTSGLDDSTGDETGRPSGWCLERTELPLAPRRIDARSRLAAVDGGYLWFHGAAFSDIPGLNYYDSRGRFVDGSFSVDAEVYVSNSSAQQMAFFADFNGDGIMDALRSNNTELGTSMMHYGAADPDVFGPPVLLDFGSGSEELVALSDFDGDGSTDIAYYDWISDALEVWLSDGGTTVTADLSGPAPGGPVGTVYGKVDVGDPTRFVASYGPSATFNYDGELFVYRVVGGAVTIDAAAFPLASGQPYDVRDNDGEGESDVFLASGGQLHYWDSNGLGVLEDTGFSVPAARAFVRDFDADGDADVLYWDDAGDGFVVESIDGVLAAPYPIPDAAPLSHGFFGPGYLHPDLDGDGLEEAVFSEQVGDAYLNVIVRAVRC